MSTILYVQGDGIYSDSKHVRTLGDSNIRVFYDKKIFTTPCGKYIYANAGMYNFGNVHKYTSKAFDIFYSENDNRIATSRVPNIDDTPVSNGTLLVYSKEYDCWVHHKDNGVENLGSIQLAGIPYYAIGSGGQIAMAYMRLTGDPIVAMEKTLCHDRLSGGEIQYVSFDTLK